MIKAIFCSSANGGIGMDNTIPWYCPEDFKYFKEYTKNKTIVMGYNTWLSLPKKPLPERKNIIVTNRPVSDFEETSLSTLLYETDLKQFLLESTEDIIIIGGSYIYDLVINQWNMVDEISWTIIDGEYDCDRFFSFEVQDYVLNREEQIAPNAKVQVYNKKDI